MKYVYIQNTDDRPPNHRLVSIHETYAEVLEQLCADLFGCKPCEVDSEHLDEWNGQSSSFSDEGFLSFEGDPGVSWGIIP